MLLDASVTPRVFSRWETLCTQSYGTTAATGELVAQSKSTRSRKLKAKLETIECGHQMDG